MQEFIYFLGRFHVLALHLPIAIVLVAVALDVVARREPYRRLAAAAPFLWGFAAISSIGTAALGYMHFSEGGFTGPSAYSHRLFGTAVAAVTVVIWWLSARNAELYRKVNIATGTLAVALVAITGHYGGNLTHGPEFLHQYAPWGSAASQEPATSGVTSPAAAAPVVASSAVVDELYTSGFLVRQVSQTDPHLVVSVYSPGARIVAAQMAVLESAAPEIVELNLQDAGLDDVLLERIGLFTELTRLRLSRNDITDRTVAEIASSMPQLERLNLYANPDVTDASVDVLAQMSSLRRLDIWRTSISEEGMARLRDLRPDLELQGETADVIRAVDPLGPPLNGAQ
jgi:uncharacterized membrane protein